MPIVSYKKKCCSITETYAERHPALHVEDSPWKFRILKSAIDDFNKKMISPEINLLDVGGGAGLILQTVSNYLRTVHKKDVNKFALDICPKILKKQKNKNPDLKASFNEDITKTSLSDKNIDLTLIIDVLEHIPDSDSALKEIKRISKYALFKVPLENNLYSKFYNFVKRGKPRQASIENLGHLNIYNIRELKSQISKNTGKIIFSNYADVYSYYLNEKFYKNRLPILDKFFYLCASCLYKLSPQLPSKFLTDFSVFLVKCDPN